MTHPETSRESRRRVRVIASLVGGVLAVAGAGAIAVAVQGQDPAPPQAPRARATSTGSSSPAPTTTKKPGGKESEADRSKPAANAAPELGWSRPVQVSIPSIGVSSSLEELGLDSEGAMEVPEDPGKAGWFTPAPPPGVVGTSVIAGHVTWNQDPAVFFKLGDLRPGDRVKVDRADGVTAVFKVTRIGQFPKSEFPTQAVYGHSSTKPELRLITCGGNYDEDANRYLANVVVWATMVSPT